MRTKLQKINEGFTIVEVLIVLAIAALILTIILIAVPDLQRSARNTDIYHDAQNVASAVQSYEGNNQGSIPGAVAATKGATITIGASGATTTATVQGSTYVVQTATVPTAVGFKAGSVTNGTKDVGIGYLVVVDGADCNGTSPGPASGTSLTPGADARGVAVYYPIEISGGGNVGCIQE